MKRHLVNIKAGLLSLAALLMCGNISAQAPDDDLQSFIHQTANRQQTRADGDDFVEVDLSTFQAVERLTTLQIPSGKYRFINGSLTKSSSLEGPMVQMSGGSIVEVGQGANFGIQMGGVVNGAPMLILDNAKLVVAGGSIAAGYVQGGKFDDVVWMSNSADAFILDNGFVDGAIVCQVINATINLNGGWLHTRGADYGTIYTYSDVHTTGEFWLHVDLQGIDNVVKLSSELKPNMEITGGDKTAGDVIVRGDNYTLTNADLAKVTFKSKKYSIDLQDNAIVLVEGDDLQQYINSLQPGTLSDVNLSQFKAVTRTKTLLVSGGRLVRFINGTLNRATTLNAPVMLVEGSYVEVSTDAAITGQGHIADNNACEVIRLNSSSLKITDGYVEGACEVRNFTDGSLYLGGPGHDPAIAMTSLKDELILDGGTIYGGITCSVSDASIKLKSGKFCGIRYKSNEQAARQMVGPNRMPASGSYEPTIDTYSNVQVGNVETYSFNWGMPDKPTFISSPIDITFHGKQTVILQQSKLPGGWHIKAPDKVNNDVLIYGDNYQLTNDDLALVKYEGNTRYQVVRTGNKIFLYYDDLQSFIDDHDNGNGTGDDPYKTNVPCNGVNVNNGVEFPEDDLQWFITGQPEVGSVTEEADTCQGAIRQNEGDIIIRPGSTVTFTHIYFWGCGCKNYIYVWGTLIIDYNIYIYNYLRFIYLRPGGRVIIRGLNGTVIEEFIYIEGGTVEYRGGDITGGTYGWYNIGGVIYIYDGTIRGTTCGGYTGPGGKTYIHGGTIYGGFVNYGTTYWYGGTVTGICTVGNFGHTIYNYKGGIIYIYGGTCNGPGTIWSQGDIYIDGGNTVTINDIYVILGCRIYILSKLTYILRLHITIENIVLDTPIILGGEGYRLTADDCNYLQIELPEGYEWRYDEATGGIIISKIDAAVSAVKLDGKSTAPIHDMQGRRTERTVNGQVYTRKGKKYIAK